MRSETSHVRIFRGGPFLDRDDFAELVATIRLGNAQSVREMEAEASNENKRSRTGKDRP
jgi:hypothetical protein